MIYLIAVRILRRILHCDLNNFFASVEQVRNPELKNVPMAVCGDPNKRHGIILAKNYVAKKYGIYTPELVTSAKGKCPNLVLVEPHYEEYVKYSKLVNEVYLKYTDRVEPFSIDESFLDVTESEKIFGSAREIAYKIKEEIKQKYGLTISVGVSFNKFLAKMGSDMKKPDAITELYEDDYKSKIYKMPIANMIFAGKATCEELKKYRIETIGDIAYSNREFLVKKIGKIGGELFDRANGIDISEVKKYTDLYIPKSISKGITLQEDTSDIEVLLEICERLTVEVVSRLRKQKLECSVVCVSLKNSMFITTNRQRKISSTSSYQCILKCAKEILKQMLEGNSLIRTITISVSNFTFGEQKQINLFSAQEENKRCNLGMQVLEKIKDKNKDIKIGFASDLKKE